MKMLHKLKSFFKKITRAFNPIITSFQRINIKKIKTRLILAFLVPVIFIILQGTINYVNTSSTASQRAIQSSEIAMENTGKYIGVILQQVENLSGQIFSDTDVQDYLRGYYKNRDALSRSENYTRVKNMLFGTATFAPEVESIMLIPADKSSYPIATKTPTGIYMDQLEGSEIFLRLSEDTSRGLWYGIHNDMDKLNNVGSDYYSLSYIRLITDLYTHDTIGVLVIDIKKSLIENLTSEIDLADNQQICFISHDGRVFINGADQTESSAVTEQDFYQRLVSSDDVTGSDMVTFEGVKYLMTYYKIGSTGNVLLGLVPYASLTQASRAIVFSTVIFVVIAAAVAFCIGILISNSMSRTINRIIDASGQAASGDLSVTLESRRKDELGTLTRSINSMISNMRSLIEHTIKVSDKVAESAVTVSSTSRQVADVSQEITRAIQEISEGAASQASDAEQGVKRISILAENINHVTENAKSIAKLTQDTMSETRNGMSAVEDLDVKANRTATISGQLMDDIKELDVHSKSIGKIINAISAIADQTNLLALNAAIEAARAGEAGKGFAVVADEVRKLAEQSMNSAREISDLIKSTQNQTAKAVEKVSDTESILLSQNEAVQETIQVFKRIMSSMESLSEQVEQIMKRISEMEENKEHAINSIQNISAVSQETAASSQEVTASTQEQLSGIEELSRFADELKKSLEDLQAAIDKFKL
jgi:methyl-accepting chemotaxis protein